eukprot:3934679-Rhodomonas_salina.2
MTGNKVSVLFASTDGITHSAEVEASSADWEVFKGKVRDQFRERHAIEIPSHFALSDLGGREVGPEIFDLDSKLPAELRIAGHTKGQLGVENSIEGIRNVQHEDSVFKGLITASLGEGTFRCSDNGSAIKAEDIERAITFCKPLQREEGEGREIRDMLRGAFGRYGVGLKGISKAGIEEKQLVMGIYSKDSAASHMLFAKQDYAEMFTKKAYETLIDHDPELDSRFFSLDGEAGEDDFVGRHGTVIDCEKCDTVFYTTLCKNGKLKPKYLSLLAAKYYFYTNPRAFAAILELILAVGKEVDARERSE